MIDRKGTLCNVFVFNCSFCLTLDNRYADFRRKRIRKSLEKTTYNVKCQFIQCCGDLKLAVVVVKLSHIFCIMNQYLIQVLVSSSFHVFV